MWLIVGLGNPGKQYAMTRHNVGFMVVDELARRAGQLVHIKECEALTARVRIAEKIALLVKPQTFMNLSGVAVTQLQAKYEQHDVGNVLVITDDFALPLGKVRVRRKGSAGGHNGLKSMIAKLKTENFPRLRLGIAPNHPISNAANFVLGDFSRDEKATLEEMIERAADAAETIIATGVNSAMNKFNGEVKAETTKITP